MIRLIATDLDDTLLNAASDLSPRTAAALDAAMAAGCGIALNSGRMLEATLPFAERIGVNAPMLLYNGAMIYDHRTGETIHAQRVPFATALGIARLLEGMGFYFQVYPGMGYYCPEVLDCTRRYAASIRVNCGTSCVKRPPVATNPERPGSTMPWLISTAMFRANTCGSWNSASRWGVSTSLTFNIGPAVCTIMCLSGDERMVVVRNLLSPRMFQTILPLPCQPASNG